MDGYINEGGEVMDVEAVAKDLRHQVAEAVTLYFAPITWAYRAVRAYLEGQ